MKITKKTKIALGVLATILIGFVLYSRKQAIKVKGTTNVIKKVIERYYDSTVGNSDNPVVTGDFVDYTGATPYEKEVIYMIRKHIVSGENGQNPQGDKLITDWTEHYFNAHTNFIGRLFI
jgi:hypothetical protein